MTNRLSMRWKRAIVLALVAVICAFVAPTSIDGQLTITALPVGMPSSLRLGWSGPLALKKLDGSANVDTVALGHPALVGYLIAIAEANNSTEWLPFTQLEGLFADTKSDVSEILAAAYDFAHRDVITVIGDLKDLTTTQDVLKRFSIPEISPNSFLPELTRNHDTLYPFFMRNSFSLVSIARETVRLVQALGYTRSCLVYSNEAFAISGSTVYFESAKNLGLELPVSPNYIAGETDWSSLIQRIVDARLRIIMFLGNPYDLRALWRFAAKLEGLNNIVGDGYLWVINYSVAAPVLTTDASGVLIADLASLAAGQVSTLINTDPTNPAAIRFQQLYRQTPYNANASTVHPEDLTRQVPYTALFSYDATWISIRALHRMIYELGVDPRPLENRALLMQTMVNVSFLGATGPIQTDTKGDRTTSFAVGNFKRSTNTWVPVGFLGPNNPPHIDLYPGQDFEWPGSDPMAKPVDHEVRTIRVISSPVQVGLIVTCGFILLVCILLQAMVAWFRNSRVLKASSPIFLLINLIGVELLCSSVIPRVLESHYEWSPQVCNADLFLANIGYTLLIGALLVKTIRLHQIFQHKSLASRREFSDPVLLLMLFGLVAIEVGMLLGLAVGLPMSIRLREYGTLEDYYVCRTSSETENELNTIYLPVIMVTRFALILVTTVVVYRVRDLPDQFNETKQLGLTIYNLLFLSVLLPAIDGTLGRGLDTPVIAYSVCIFLICSVSVCILFLPKLNSLRLARASGEGITQAPPHLPLPAGVGGLGVGGAGGGPTTRADEKARYRAGPTVSDGSEFLPTPVLGPARHHHHQHLQLNKGAGVELVSLIDSDNPDRLVDGLSGDGGGSGRSQRHGGGGGYGGNPLSDPLSPVLENGYTMSPEKAGSPDSGESEPLTGAGTAGRSAKLSSAVAGVTPGGYVPRGSSSSRGPSHTAANTTATARASEPRSSASAEPRNHSHHHHLHRHHHHTNQGTLSSLAVGGGSSASISSGDAPSQLSSNDDLSQNHSHTMFTPQNTQLDSGLGVDQVQLMQQRLFAAAGAGSAAAASGASSAGLGEGLSRSSSFASHSKSSSALGTSSHPQPLASAVSSTSSPPLTRPGSMRLVTIPASGPSSNASTPIVQPTGNSGTDGSVVGGSSPYSMLPGGGALPPAALPFGGGVDHASSTAASSPTGTPLRGMSPTTSPGLHATLSGVHIPRHMMADMLEFIREQSAFEEYKMHRAEFDEFRKRKNASQPFASTDDVIVHLASK